MDRRPIILVLGQAAGILGLFFFTLVILTSPVRLVPFLDNANLLIHESGHTFFAPLGEFMGFLGGSLTQLLVPAAFALYFWYSGHKFSLAACLFWTGENLINISVYIRDARSQLLPLINNGINDWNWILGKLQMLQFDQVIGGIVYDAGLAICLGSLVWAIIIFYNRTKGLRLQKTST